MVPSAWYPSAPNYRFLLDQGPVAPASRIDMALDGQKSVEIARFKSVQGVTGLRAGRDLRGHMVTE